MRSGNTFLPKKQKDRLNAPPAPFVWETQAMLESEAYRHLSVNARRVIARLQVEHLAHGGLENGRLPVSYADFVAYGIRRSAIRPAIEESVAAGFIRVEQQGHRNRGSVQGAPAEYRLTWLPVATETDHRPATNEWKAAKPSAKKVFPWSRKRDSNRAKAGLESRKRDQGNHRRPQASPWSRKRDCF